MCVWVAHLAANWRCVPALTSRRWLQDASTPYGQGSAGLYDVKLSAVNAAMERICNQDGT